jgi:uncharacterized protein DUF6929
MTTSIRPAIRAILGGRLQAVLDEVAPLRYAAGALPAFDLPAHVRAASAIRRLGKSLAIVQDDVNALALRDEQGRVHALPFPGEPGARRRFDDLIGNKSGKLDLEACAALPDGRLLAFGSGATGARETLVVIEEGTEPRLRRAADFYAMLRAERAFSGAELNVEGAVLHGAELWLFQRATGSAGRGAQVVNAVGILDLEEILRWLDERGPTPRLVAVIPAELGAIGGRNLGFTDAAETSDGRIAVLACAEDAADALTDGAVLGCRFGFIAGRELEMTDVVDAHGDPTHLKLEGIEPRPGSRHEFDVVADMDRPEEPACIGRLSVSEQR